MCGFAGEFLFGPGQADVQLACAMASKLTHRGPDEQGSFFSADGRCAIGFRRLSIIDPAGSAQPMSSADGAYTVAFNGEIYNFRSLRAELTGQGAVFKTNGDAEVLLHLYRREGLKMLEQITGMFAFVLYDPSAGRLLLARDRLGQKPLWYTVLSDRLIFASEAKALLVHPRVEKQIDRKAITAYLTMGYVPSPRCAWTGIRKLSPAHRMVVSAAGPRLERYWAAECGRLVGSRTELIELVRTSLTAAVEARMVADVPLGALLSGGVDSAIIVALMSRAAGRGGGVRTFTAGFQQQGFDERPAARRVARHCGTDHTELLVQPEPSQMLDRLVSMYDEPFADSSAFPTWLICQAARREVTVALTGDGGDEVFCGYDRYRALSLAETIGPSRYLAIRLAAAAVRPFASGDERSRLRRFLRFADVLREPFSVQYFVHRRLFGPDDLASLLTRDFASTVDIDDPMRWFCDLYEQGNLPNEPTRAQQHDLLTYLPDDLLVKADIASMAASLELRAPMLDHNVVNLGLSLPTSMKLGWMRGKRILREAFGDILPPEVFNRPKRGFAVPLGTWLREELLETLRQSLLDPALDRQGIFRREALEGLINDHLSGRADHRHRLWALLVFARWLDVQR